MFKFQRGKIASKKHNLYRYKHSNILENVGMSWYNIFEILSGVAFDFLYTLMLVYKRKKEKRHKSAKQMERHLKGVANHRRIEILFLIAGNPGITVENLAGNLDCNAKTISEHTRRLVQAGLVRKNYKGRNVAHELSPYGKIIHKFLKTFQHS